MNAHRLAKVRFGIGLVSLTAVTAVVWLVLWASVVPLIRGWSPVAVVTGSMAPRIEAGDIVVAAPYDGEPLQPGTVIVFDNPSGTGTLTHRVVDRTPSGEYVTRGDANTRIDSTPVRPDAIRGIGRILVPVIGTPFVWASQNRTTYLLVGALVAFASLWCSRWALLVRYNPWRNSPPPPVQRSIDAIGAVLGVWPERGSIARPGPSDSVDDARTTRHPRLLSRHRPALATTAVALAVAGALVTSTGIRAEAAFTYAPDNTNNTLSAATLDPPTGLTATPSASTVQLDWTATPDAWATGHRILRSTTPGGPYTQIADVTPRTTTSYVDDPGAAGTYYYVARAYHVGWESSDSAEAAATVDEVGLAGAWQTGLTHTAPAGSDRVLVFVASNEQTGTTTPTLSSVTYGGQPLTPVLSDQVTSYSRSAGLEVWILDEAGLAAAAGSSLVPVWTSGPEQPLYSHAVFDHVDQTTPTGDTTTVTTNDHLPNPAPIGPVITSNLDMVVAAATAGELGTYTPQNGFALGINQDAAPGGTSALGTAYKAADGSAETASMLFVSASPPDIRRQVSAAVVLNLAA